VWQFSGILCLVVKIIEEIRIMKIRNTHIARTYIMLLCALFICFETTTYANEPQELVIFTWSDYMDPELIEKFETRYNARVRFTYFKSDELRDEMLFDTEGEDYDVILTNGRSIKLYAMRGLLAPITEQEVPQKIYIDPRWAGAFPYAEEYAVPYFWGTVGIAYRKDLLKQEISRWKDLLEPAPELQGKIVMVKDARELMAIALKSLEQSINTSEINKLELAENLLIAQKPYVRDYSYVAVTKESSLVKGEALAALAYSGDALMLAEHDENIAYVVPEEGTNIWVDYLVVSKASRRKKLAMDFISFINEPENAAQLAEHVYHASPNQAADQYLTEEFLSDPVIYPDQAVIDKSEFYHELPPRIQKRYNSIPLLIIGQ